MLLSFLEERDVARRGREAREWLAQGERSRVVRLIVVSVAISIAMSLLATAVVGVISRRRTVAPESLAAEADETGEPQPGAPDPMGGTAQPVDEPSPVEGAAEPIGA